MNIIKLMQDQIDFYLTREGQMRASTGLQMLALGRPPTPRTPLYKDTPPEEVLENWISFLDQVADDDEVLRPLVEYDKSRKSKFGPQGGLRPLSERESDLNEYYTAPKNTGYKFSASDYKVLYQASQICFGGAMNKRPQSLESIVKQDKFDDKLNTSSGCRDYATRNDPSVISNAIQAARDGLWKKLPMILGSRSQRGSERFIFMAPFSLNLIEKTFLYPMMEVIRKIAHPFFSAWEGFAQVELGFKEQNFFDEDHVYIQQDYTKMDRHFNRLQKQIVDLITVDFFQPSYSLELSNLYDHILDVPVLIGLDKLIVGEHGMPSGSGMTNFAESLVNLFIILSYREAGLKVVAFQGLGDDGVFAIKRGDMTNEEILDVMISISSRYGQVLNPEKQGISDHTTVYLQRFFDDRIPNSGVVLGMYPSILALNTAMFPERFHDPRKWSKEMEILRWIMILENCKNLPYFEEFVQYFIKGDKYKLGLALPEFFVMLPKLYEDSKAIKGFVPTYNQESMDRGDRKSVV